MPIEYKFNCPLPNGLHARPATALMERAHRWHAELHLVNLRTGEVANVRSVIELVAAGVMADDPCLVRCTGEDEVAASAALSRFITEELASLDEPLPSYSNVTSNRIPKTLEGTKAPIYTAVPASPGVGRGTLVVAGGLDLPDLAHGIQAENTATEAESARLAFNAVHAEMQQGLATESHAGAAAINRALAALLSDPSLFAAVTAEIAERQATAHSAIVSAIYGFSKKFRDSGSAYLAERCVDLEELGVRLLQKLPGAEQLQSEINLSEDSIVLARNLGAGQLLALDRMRLKGIVVEAAGTTSHVVILARSFGIPCLTGASWIRNVPAGSQGVIDGIRGLLATSMTADVERYLSREQDLARRIAARQSNDLAATASADTPQVEIAANIACAEEAQTAAALGADGVGLFRTEMIFSTASQEPSENEQYEAYRQAAVALSGRSLIIRTLDVGGDKPLPYLDLPQEENPFLGCRGIRVCQRYPELLQRQLRAILRASAHGKVWAMAPMVSGVHEAHWFREQVRVAQAELAEEGIAFDAELPIGIMIEVPSAALMVGELCEAVDFFSVGTNDLTQYLLAAERGNPAVEELYDELHPALVRLLGEIARQAHAGGRWVGLCGELARKPEYAPLLAGLGFDELSMSAPAIPAVRAALSRTGMGACRALAARTLACSRADQIRGILRDFSAGGDQPLLDAALIETHSDCRSKAEAIQELCALNFLAKRCTGVDELEDAVWKREATYSTGLGFGFAIPHCKSEAVRAGSLAVLKLAEPIDWGSLDGAPVDIVLMLTMPENDPGNRHLKVFAALSRRLMHAEFRDGLRAQVAPGRVLSYLKCELNLTDTDVTD